MTSKSLLALVLLALLSLTCDSDPKLPDAAKGGATFEFQALNLDTDFIEWTELKFLPGRSEFLALQKDGTIRHFSMSGDSATQLGTFAVDAHSVTDCGALSIAFDPEFAVNQFMYIGRCISQSHSGVSRYRFDPGDYASIVDSETEIISLGDSRAARPWHSIGSIGFFTDGSLWAVFGEKTIAENGQDITTPLGSVVRIVPNRVIGESGYTIPDDAVLVAPGAAPEIAAYGLRSPWRASVDSQDHLWIGDVGSNRFEELNAMINGGENFGWNTHEGPCVEGDCSGFTDPVASYNREGDNPYELADPDGIPTTSRAIWVGVANTSKAVTDPYNGALSDHVFFGDMCHGFMRLLSLDAEGKIKIDIPIGHLPWVSSMDLGPDGYMYVSTYGACNTSVDTIPETSQLIRIRRNP